MHLMLLCVSGYLLVHASKAIRHRVQSCYITLLIVADFCPNTDRMVPHPHYKSVCMLNSGSGVTCPCAVDKINPTKCCTAEGTTEKTEKCNGEDSCNVIIHDVEHCIAFATGWNGGCPDVKFLHHPLFHWWLSSSYTLSITLPHHPSSPLHISTLCCNPSSPPSPLSQPLRHLHGHVRVVSVTD